MKDLMTLSLKDPSLLETRAYVNGAWIEGESRFDVFDPATELALPRIASEGRG